jgi:hypothetical protein
MTPRERLDYVDLGLRANNIQLCDSIKIKFIKILDIIDKEKGKTTLDKIIVTDEI